MQGLRRPTHYTGRFSPNDVLGNSENKRAKERPGSFGAPAFSILALSRWSGRYHREQLTATASAPGASLLGGSPLLARSPLLDGSLLLAGSPLLVRPNLCPALRRLSRCSGQIQRYL